MTILVSACLLGVPCRYDGQSKAHPLARALCEKHHVVPVCGEIFGGLPTPRTPAEIQGDRVVTRDGRDVTEAYRRGAEAAAQLARLTGARAAVLKERSPSCGSGAVYDGTFSGVLTEGWGITAALLRQPQNHPYQQHQQVILLVAALDHVMQTVPLARMDDFRTGLLTYIETQDQALCRRIDESGQLSDEDRETILKLSREFLTRFQTETAKKSGE